VLPAAVKRQARPGKYEASGSNSSMTPAGVSWTFLILLQVGCRTGARSSFRPAGRIDGTECALTREVFEVHFWMPVGADARRMLKTFADGQNRMVTVAERKECWYGRTSPFEPQAMILITKRQAIGLCPDRTRKALE
jgi:hypothetical protein